MSKGAALISGAGVSPVGSEIDWKSIRRAEFIYEEACWTTCGTGFCCTNLQPDIKFTMIPQGGQSIVYLAAEYDYLLESGRLIEHLPRGKPASRLKLDFGGPWPLELRIARCDVGGICRPEFDKPLLCKLGPLLPILSVEGRLEEVIPAGAFDWTFEVFGFANPCTVAAKLEEYQDLWTREPERLDLLRHPYFIFHLKAARAYYHNFREAAARNAKLAGKKGIEFWRIWEGEQLFGRLVEADGLKAAILEAYQEVEATHGSFGA